MLNQQQKQALEEFVAFLADPKESIFIIEGHAGCGKSYLVQHLVNELDNINQTFKLINPDYKCLDVAITATTNKACAALNKYVDNQTITIHSFLGLTVSTDPRTGVSSLKPRHSHKQTNYLLFIDECSLIDTELLNWIFKKTDHCKYVFIGDPYQLAPVKSRTSPVFELKGKHIKLDTVVRNNGTQIEEFSAQLREGVKGNTPNRVKPNNKELFIVNSAEFERLIIDEFGRNDWNESQAKILTWTNNKASAYGAYVNNLHNGVFNFVAGNYAVVNNYTRLVNTAFSTDEIVLITDITYDQESHGIPGSLVRLNNLHTAFLPNDIKQAKRKIEQLRKDGQYVTVAEIDMFWIDLRAAPACTIHKSQGSTYDRVYIDYDDVKSCKQIEQFYRLMYVAVSRAKYKVYLKHEKQTHN